MYISELVSNIRTQDLVLPEFQREYVWSRDQAKQLLVSLIRKYPVRGPIVLEDPGATRTQERRRDA